MVKSNLLIYPLPQLLSYGDWVSMQASVESRNPFLSIGLINFYSDISEEDFFSYEGYTKKYLRNYLLKNDLGKIARQSKKLGYELPWSILRNYLFTKPALLFSPISIRNFYTFNCIKYYIFLLIYPKGAIFTHLKLLKLQYA